MDKPEDSSPIYTTLPPLGEGLPFKLEPREPPPAREVPTRTRARAHLRMDEPEVITTLKGDPPMFPNPSYCATGSSSTATTIGIMSPPPTPPRLTPRSPAVSRRSSGRLHSMDDSYCDRIRSTSSFGWYEESAAFESIDVPSSAFCQIEDWRNLETWDGGRHPVPRHEAKEEQLDVEFEVPNAHVTTTKTFRHANHGRPEPYAVAIGATRVIRMSAHSSHAEYQVLMSTKDEVHKAWKRFSDFKLLAEYAKISDLRDTVSAWRNIQQTQRWFRCLEANYLKTKCMLLEKFLAELLFEVPTPALLLTFVGAQQPDFTRRR